MAWAIDQQVAALELLQENIGQPVPVGGDLLTCVIPPGAIPNPDLRMALVYGCPRPFQALIVASGMDAYGEMLTMFGFDQPAEFALEGQAGEIPAPAVERDLARAATGQGDLTLSPLQIARALAVLIADGELPAIRVVSAIRSQGADWKRFEAPETTQPSIESETAAEIRSALGKGNIVSYRGKALAGEALGWFLGGSRGLGGQYAVVVVLEDGISAEAARIGEALLEAVRTSSLP
jgi:hypothetical protein